MRHWRVLDMTGRPDADVAFDELQKVAEVSHVEPDAGTLERILPDYDVYLPSLAVRLAGDLIRKCPRLRVVASPTTGLDHLDTAALEERGIHLISLKYETEFLDRVTATAEMAWALLLAVVRRLPWSFEAARRGDWARTRYRGHQLSGKTLGILGYGRLGRIIAEYGQGFRMKVIACDVRNVTPAAGVQMVDFDTLLRQSDVLTIHIHLTPENTGLIDRAAFLRMKPGAILINTSRGAITNEADLVEALDSGHLGGAGLDVIQGEWHANLRSHPLIRYANTHENLVISPHTGGSTFESEAMTLKFIADKLAVYLRNHIEVARG